MYNISVIGHFGFGLQLLNGQTIKTKIVTNELESIYGSENVKRHDTHGGVKFILRMPFVVLRMLSYSKNIIITPGKNGLFIMMPLIVFLNLFLGRNILYVVIGGWLPDLLKKRMLIRSLLKHINGIFVETLSQQQQMEALGLQNSYIMPNCKRLEIINDITPRYTSDHISLCTFSRVMREKGIEDAIEAVKTANGKIGRDVFSLDIYGQVWNRQEEWFKSLIKAQPQYIRYKGCIDYNSSSNSLKNYFALLFPTYYEGECFAGTIIDAFAAGLPVIASDWHDNPNIIKDNVNGIIFPTKSVEALSSILMDIYANPTKIDGMRSNCIQEAAKFQPDRVVCILTSQIR